MRRERWSWLLPWGVGVVAAGVEEPFVDLVGEGRAAGLYGLLGALLGWGWYRLNPRTLAQRILPGALVFCFGTALAVVAGGELAELTAIGVLVMGVLAGLVLAEGRRPGGERRRQNTGLSSGETMRERS